MWARGSLNAAVVPRSQGTNPRRAQGPTRGTLHTAMSWGSSGSSSACQPHGPHQTRLQSHEILHQELCQAHSGADPWILASKPLTRNHQQVSGDAEVWLGGARLPSSCGASPGLSIRPLETSVLWKLLHGHSVSLCRPARITASTAFSWRKTCALTNGERERE